MRKRGLRIISVALAMCMCISSVIFAAEKATEEEAIKKLTYEEACEIAIENSSDLRELADGMELAEDSREKISQSLNGLSLPSQQMSIFVTTSAYVTALKSVSSLQSTIDNAKYSRALIENGCELGVLASFIEIANAERQLEMLKETLRLTRKDTDFAELRYQLGLISANERKEANTKFEDMKTNIELLELNIESAYTALKRLLGVNYDFVIDYAAEYEPMGKVDNIEAEINKLISQDPYLVILASDIAQAELNMELFASDGETESYAQKEYNLNSANREYAGTKKDMQKSMQVTYIQIQQLEATRKTLENAIEKAKSDYITADASLAAGMITEHELQWAKMAITNAEAELVSNTYSHEMLKYMFEHPYLTNTAN
ncbi:MAG: TolC family protein [Firmicutes bacterium]|nr:TolC family protein [Bacillota bacterium]